jgi:hypothetical protein
MKYTNEIIINAPREKVVKLFEDPDNIKEWQPGFISMEVISGEPGQEGSKTKMRYKMGKRDVEMIETITVNKLPEEFSGTYEAKGVYNLVNNYFESLSDGQTKYWSISEFQFKGFMKLIGFLFPGAFKKESQKYLVQFKAFVERS